MSNGMDFKQLKVHDQTLEDLLHDEFVTGKDFNRQGGGMRGVAVFKNRQGDVLMRKRNLVLLRGRIHTLQRLFCETDRTTQITSFDVPSTGPASFFPNEVDVPTPNPWGTYVDTWSGGTYTDSVNRMMCLFRIGNGAYDIENNPWTLVNPPHSYNLHMGNPRPFRIIDKGVSGWVNEISRPDPLNGNKTLEHIYPAKNVGAAADLVNIGESDPDWIPFVHKLVSDTEVQYLYKRFNCTTTDPYSTGNFIPEWACHYGQNSACVKMTLWLDEGDALGDKINELSLHIANARHDGTQVEFKHPEIFSHITFESEPMHDNKDIKIEYFLFA